MSSFNLTEMANALVRGLYDHERGSREQNDALRALVAEVLGPIIGPDAVGALCLPGGRTQWTNSPYSPWAKRNKTDPMLLVDIFVSRMRLLGAKITGETLSAKTLGTNWPSKSSVASKASKYGKHVNTALRMLKDLVKQCDGEKKMMTLLANIRKGKEAVPTKPKKDEKPKMSKPPTDEEKKAIAAHKAKMKNYSKSPYFIMQRFLKKYQPAATSLASARSHIIVAREHPVLWDFVVACITFRTAQSGLPAELFLQMLDTPTMYPDYSDILEQFNNENKKDKKAPTKSTVASTNAPSDSHMVSTPVPLTINPSSSSSCVVSTEDTNMPIGSDSNSDLELPDEKEPAKELVEETPVIMDPVLMKQYLEALEAETKEGLKAKRIGDGNEEKILECLPEFCHQMTGLPAKSFKYEVSVNYKFTTKLGIPLYGEIDVIVLYNGFVVFVIEAKAGLANGIFKALSQHKKLREALISKVEFNIGGKPYEMPPVVWDCQYFTMSAGYNGDNTLKPKPKFDADPMIQCAILDGLGLHVLGNALVENKTNPILAKFVEIQQKSMDWLREMTSTREFTVMKLANLSYIGDDCHNPHSLLLALLSGHLGGNLSSLVLGYAVTW